MAHRAVWLLGLALTLPFALPLPASAADEQRLFGCGIDDFRQFISIYAIQEEDGSWHDLHFMIERDGIVELSVRETHGAEPRVFYFSNSSGPDGYLAEVRFNHSGREHVLSMLDVPPDTQERDDLGGRVAALAITGQGARQELRCGEVDEYIGYMQEAMACDMANPYGVAGCSVEERPQRSMAGALPSSLQ